MKKSILKTVGGLALTAALALGLGLAGCAKKGGGEAGGLININTAPRLFGSIFKMDDPSN